MFPSKEKKKRVSKKQLEALKQTQNIQKFLSKHTGKTPPPDLNSEQSLHSQSITNIALHEDMLEDPPRVVKMTENTPGKFLNFRW